MAQRRMFSKTITNSSQFLMMPQSSQNLYFHLGMNADDDGFCEHFTIMRMTESKPDDLKILQAKKFINVFDDKVLVILDWKENNYLRSDRYSASKYLEIYKQELIGLSSGIPVVDKVATQDRIGKDRIGKDTEGLFLPDWLDKPKWQEWLEYRKSRKLTNSKLTLSKQIQLLEENKNSHKDIIEKSIRNGWQGLFLDKKQFVKENKEFTIQDTTTGRISTKRFVSEEEAKRFISLNRDWDGIQKLLKIIEIK